MYKNCSEIMLFFLEINSVYSWCCDTKGGENVQDCHVALMRHLVNTRYKYIYVWDHVRSGSDPY